MSDKMQTLGQKIKKKEQNLISKFPILESSEKDGSISKTFKGVALSLVPVILTLAEAYGVPLTRGELFDLINVSTILIAAVTTIYGLIRKLYNKYV